MAKNNKSKKLKVIKVTTTHPIDRCPHCGGTNVRDIMPFDYIMECLDCGREFMR